MDEILVNFPALTEANEVEIHVPGMHLGCGESSDMRAGHERIFENSLATMVELLDAQTALNQIRANLVETETSYALASGRVHYVAGIFLKEMLK